jgi:TldD protein
MHKRRINHDSFSKNSAADKGVLFSEPYRDGSVPCQTTPCPTGYFETEFGLDSSLRTQLLETALSRGGDFADLYFEHTLDNWLMLEDGRVNQSYGVVNLGVGIRTVKGDQVGYGYTQDLSRKAVLSAAKTAASLVNASAGSIAVEFKALSCKNYYPLQSLKEIPMEKKLPLVRTINTKCFEKTSAVVKVTSTLRDSIKRILVVTSDGIVAEDIIPRNFLHAFVRAEQKGRLEQSGYGLGGRYDFSFYSENLSAKIADEAVRRVLRQFDAVRPPAGEMPVVLGPGVTGVLLHEAIGHGMEADFNRKRKSTYCTMLGKKVAEPWVTIIDSGTMDHQVGSINFDDEGTPSKKTILVEKGILTGYLHDKISAKQYGVALTGNGRRESYAHYPLPRMRNTYMLGGEETAQDVIRKAKNGIYIEDVANGEVRIGAGDFAFYVTRGCLIEDGRLTAPIKDINIMGNGPKMLANIKCAANDLKMNESGGGACGKDGQMVPVSFGLPTCLITSMTVGGTGKKGASA